MFFLQLLGGASVHRAGALLHGPVSQRHRIALLALLILSREQPLSRDKLIGLLWPDSDSEHGRHLLSEALYVIRKTMGEAAVLTNGDRVQLNAEVVDSDVFGFARALAAGEVERAVELYAGPLLDGFFLDGGGEFERRIEQERARLAAALERALETLAERRGASGDLAGAVDAWRRRAALDPYSPRVALQLMQALAAAGERMAAVQHARVHAVLLREEFAAEADPDVSRYAERLRAEPMAAAVESPVERIADELAPAPEPPAADPPDRAAPAAQRPLPARRARATLRPGLLPTAGLLLLLAGVTGVAVVLYPGTGRPADRTIAVLPFVDMSPARDQEWLSDGIAEDLIHALGALNGVRVAARGSTFTYRGGSHDVREIGRRLGVTHVVEGSVRRSGDRIRVTAQLISTRDGFQVWSETYAIDPEEVPHNVFEVQDQIARAIVDRLRVRLAAEVGGVLARPPTSDLEAYQLYHRGRYFWNTRSPEGLLRGMEHFQRAVERDPGYAAAHAGLADSYALLVTVGALSPRDGYSRTRVAAERALELDPLSADAHAALALVRLYVDHDWAGAEARFRQALRLNPSYATGHHWYGQFLAYRGDTEAAMREVRRAQQLDPLSLPIQTAVGTVLYYARRYDEAAEQFRRVLEVEPDFYLARLQLGAVYLQQRRFPEALVEAREAVRVSDRHPLALALLGYLHTATGAAAEAERLLAELEALADVRHVSPAYPAVIQMGLGRRGEALERLERAYEARDDWVVFLRAEPAFDPLRSEPRFMALLARVGR
jgi:TolB-like protein/DNA-binding SARP family transcriptional activator/Tfp pilus assembly protein PilF